MNLNTLTLAAAWIKAQAGPYRSRLERASMRYFDGRVTTDELHAALVNVFGADGGW